MSPLFALFLLGAVWTAQCNVVGTMEQTKDAVFNIADYEDGDYDSFDNKLGLDEEDDETELDNDLSEPTGNLAEMEDELNVDDLLSDLDLEQMLSSCRRGKCRFCYSRRMLRRRVEVCASAVFSRRSVRISVSARVNGRHVFSRSWSISRRNFTIPIPRAILPPVMRPFLSGRFPIKIELTNINIRRKKFCVRILVRVRFFGTVRSPRKCF